jgi:hypothetical protein
MNLVIKTEKFNIDNVMLYKTSKYKTRLGYKENKLLMNGLCLHVNIHDICFINLNNNYKCTFAYQRNKYAIFQLIQLEKDLLEKYKPILNKVPSYNICREVAECPGTLSLSKTRKGLYKGIVIKIIGIWETDKEYGLIYYFYPIHNEI